MKEVFVYVEGPSDQLSMEKLLAGAIEKGAELGNAIGFYPLGGKEPLLKKGPLRALNILRNKPNSWVFLVPDLYPANKPFPHDSYNDLKKELEQYFLRELEKKGCDKRLKDRFIVHCFKYDLEALLLASEMFLMKRLGVSKFTQKWVIPVEDQNNQTPPKRIVEALFYDAGKKYKETSDAPWILERSDYEKLKERCPQNFMPFLKDLLDILQNG